MLEFIKEKKDCMGCTACVNICPVDCITMKEDEEGFKYPTASDKCINCKKCDRVCPINTNNVKRKPDIEQYALAGVSKQIDTWIKSTSGGAFTEICHAYGDEDTVIFGAGFDGLKVAHSYVVGVENIDIFRKSKYVQSDMNDCFKKAEKFLKEGRKVIFSGTPCQIGGLRSYLRQEYNNLLCIDFICHGVGSPKVFKDMLNYVENKYKLKITKYTFRYKKVIMGNFAEYSSNYVFNDNKNKTIKMDEYNQLFLNQLCVRESCQDNCKFKVSDRMGDITIADFKGKDNIFPKLNDYRNYSTIIINSTKANTLVKKLKDRMDIYNYDLDLVKKYNPLFYKTTKKNEMRDEFFRDYTTGVELDTIIKKYTKPVKSRGIRKYIPYNIKRKILKIIK